MVYCGYLTHFGHANIIKYCNRPFANIVEMDKTIISNWNKVVRADDLVYHLGDFCMSHGHTSMDFHKYISQLNGNIVFIKGNHDKLSWANRSRFYAHYDSYHEISLNGQDITLCHYSMKTWNKSHHSAWHLYGHSHGTLQDDPHSLSFDVGVDCHNFTPINFEKVKEIMSRKYFVPIDHHGSDRQEGGGVGLSREEYARLDRKRLYTQLKKEFKND